MKMTTNAGLVLAAALGLAACSGEDLSIITEVLNDGKVGDGYSTSLVAQGGDGVYQWTVSGGALPSGIRLDLGGNVEGFPREAGSFDFTATVRSGDEEDSRQFTLRIGAGDALSIDTPSVLSSATVGESYEATIVASGGSGTGYAWTVASSELPSGLTLAESGTPNTMLSGIPADSGDFTFTVRVTDSDGTTADLEFTLEVLAAPNTLTILTTALPDGVVQLPYEATLEAANNEGMVTWSVTQGTLPGGLALASSAANTAVITGTPTEDGTFTIEIAAVDESGARAEETFTFDVTLDVQPLRIVTTELPDGRIGASYSAELRARNGTGRGYRWSIASGKLPPGLQLQSEGTPTTTILGAPEGEADSYDVAIEVVDDAGNKTRASFVIVVRAPEITILNGALPDGNVGVPYDVELLAAGGEGGPYTFTMSGGTLPPGLSIEAVGAVVGTPTMTGSFTFVVRAVDGAGNFGTAQLTIDVGDVLAIPSTVLDSGAVGIAYSDTITAVGGAGNYTWQVASGSLPPGLTLTTAAGVATIAGTPTMAGSFMFDLSVSDGGGASASATFTLLVQPELLVTTTTLPDGNAFDPYVAPVVATGGTPGPVTWTLASGALPSGIQIVSDGTRTLSVQGRPDTPGMSTFTLQVEDQAGATAQQTFTVTVTGDLTIATRQLPGAVSGQSYSAEIVGAGGSDTGFVWQVSSGTLPPGLALASGTPAATISGTPTALGTSTFQLTVTDSLGSTATQEFDLTVAADALVITTSALNGAALCASTSTQLAATGGTGSGRLWTFDGGTPPPGLTLDPSTGLLSGRATTPGSFTFDIRVTDDGNFTDTASFTVAVAAAVVPDRYAILTGDILVNNQHDVFIVDVCGDAPGTLVQISPTASHAADAAPAEDLVTISPDGSKAAFVGDFSVDGQNDLYVVDLTSATPSAATSVNSTMVTGGNVTDYFWSPDGARLAFVADKDVDDKAELYIVDVSNPASPGAPAKISAPMPNSDTDVSDNDVFWSPDGGFIAYHADPALDDVGEVFVVDVRTPTQLGTAEKVHGDLSMTQSCSDDIVWAPDSSGIVFRCDLVLADRYELWWFNPARNSAQQPTRVANQPFDLFSDVALGSFSFSTMTPPALVYLADLTYDGVDEIWYSQFADGAPGPAVRAIGGLTPTENTTRVIWSPDGSTLALRADLEVDGRFDLFVADTSSGVPTTTVGVSQFTTGAGDVAASRQRGQAFEFSPDGQYLVYLADAAATTERRLWSADLSTVPPAVSVESSATMDGARDVVSFAISPDSQRILYRGDVTVDEQFELLVVGIAGFDPLLPANVHPPLSGDSDVSSDYAWRSDGGGLFFVGDVRIESVTEAFFVRLASPMMTPQPAQPLAPALTATGDVRSFFVVE